MPNGSTVDPPWLPDAMQTLACSGHGDAEGALDAIERLIEYGPDGLGGAMVAWVEVLRTIAVAQGVPMLTEAQRLQLLAGEEPTEVQWSLELLNSAERYDRTVIARLSNEIRGKTKTQAMGFLLVLTRIVARNASALVTGPALRLVPNGSRT